MSAEPLPRATPADPAETRPAARSSSPALIAIAVLVGVVLVALYAGGSMTAMPSSMPGMGH